MRQKCRANAPFTGVSSGPSQSKMSVTVTGFPGLLLTGAFPLLPFEPTLASGQHSPFCPHLHTSIPSVFPSGGRSALASYRALIVVGRVVSVRGVCSVGCVCSEATLQGQSGSLYSAPWTSPSPLPSPSPPQPPCHLVSGRGEIGLDLSFLWHFQFSFLFSDRLQRVPLGLKVRKVKRGHLQTSTRCTIWNTTLSHWFLLPFVYGLWHIQHNAQRYTIFLGNF